MTQLATGALQAGDVALLGIASDANSSFMRGPAMAPERIRRILHGGASGLGAENGQPVVDHPRFRDIGDRAVSDDDADFMRIQDTVADVLTHGATPLILGGDHAITYPVLRAIAAHHGPVSILHFDAHPDLYEEFDGSRLSHASPFARIMEEGLATRLVQVGIRSVNEHLLAQIKRYGVEVHAMHAFDLDRVPVVFDGPTYLSFDLDALDPAYAPGVSHHEPGGLCTRDALTIIQRVRANFVGADVVEYNPHRDLHDVTAMVAAKLVREIGHRLLSCAG